LGDLVNSLQPSFNQRGRELKKEIAETLVPTVNLVKGLYKKIETDVDISFGMGILMFNKACKEMEGISIKDQDEIKHAWGIAQVCIPNLADVGADAPGSASGASKTFSSSSARRTRLEINSGPI